ncbi:unnamed protein product [Miscanthus lutarioriparius]|uniref:Secreted protein n=1 Tax=Miscanthus lutarioriparius TaxID=422564 RepID=A0A811RGZ1_9POAL|nr:unnamed protein product [Miscanthus lutarioriparius]
MALPQSQLAGVVAVVVVVVMVVPEDELVVVIVVVPEDELVVVLVRLAQDELVIVRVAAEVESCAWPRPSPWSWPKSWWLDPSASSASCPCPRTSSWLAISAYHHAKKQSA